MVRLGWKRFLTVCVVLFAVGAPLGETGVSAAFMLIGIMSITALVQATRAYRPPHAGIWYTFAFSASLFLIGGVADLFTPMSGDGVSTVYPGFREPFDFAAYVGFVFGCTAMARARLAHRDRTATLDALIGMGGVGALAWAGVMTEYLASDELTTAGKSVGVMFTAISLVLGFSVARVAIGPGARPPAYYFLAAGASGAFIAEITIELELTGRTLLSSSGIETIAVSAAAITMLAAAALHPSMVELTRPPVEATPNITSRRVAMMTVAVLIPPALLLIEETENTQIETVAIIGVWAVLSVMVMFRVFSLARTRERMAHLDRLLAAADGEFAAAADRETMFSTATQATFALAPGTLGVALRSWDTVAGAWVDLHTRGIGSGPPPEDPQEPGRRTAYRNQNAVVSTFHFSLSDDRPAALTVDTASGIEEDESHRVEALLIDLSRAIESLTLREEIGRQRSERRFRSLVENSADIVAVLDDDNRLSFVSPAAPRLLGFEEHTLLGQPLTAIVANHHRAEAERIIATPTSVVTEIEFVCRGGSTRWFGVTTSDMTHEAEIDGLVVTASEISGQKRAQRDLARSEARFRSLVQHSSDLVLVVDANGFVSWCSPSSHSVLGLDVADVVDREMQVFVHPSDRDVVAGLVARFGPATQSPHRAELRVRHISGAWRTLEVAVTNLLDDPNVGGIVVNAHDITERKNLEHTLRHQALHDDLTGIANRVLFRERMQQSLDRLRGEIALLVIDLDDFKTVNDGLGHSTGDELLRVLAFRLQQFVRASDTAARLGGDEFAILIEGDPSRSEVLAIAQRLLRTIEEPFETQGREIRLHASVGIAFASDLEQPTPETLLRSADLAMYGAKNRGKSRVTVFDESMHEGVFERLELKADLGRALEERQLLLHYQPVVDIQSGQIAGLEALMRWSHPERGMVGPGTFIPLAEETGLIVPIGRWLIREALAQLARWQQRDSHQPPLTMAINLSGRQLEEPDIVQDIAAGIELAGVDPSTVIIELTESILVEEFPELVERLDAIRDLGVSLYADDFGAGFASYSALQSLPFNGVKIDRSLVSGLDTDAAGRAEAQIRSIIEMAAETEMNVVAEGIESGVQASVLRGLHCARGQGFYYARPDAAAAIEPELGRRDLSLPEATATEPTPVSGY